MSNEKKMQKSPNSPANNSLLISPNRGLYLGAGFGTRFHAFHAVKVCIGIDGNFGFRTGVTADYERCRAVIVAPNQVHQINGRATRLALLYLQPETAESQQIAEIYLDCGFSALPQTMVDALLRLTGEYFKKDCDEKSAPELCSNLIQALAPAVSLKQRFDWRVTSALEYLRSTLGRRLSTADIAKALRSSHSRLAHLFKAQTGTAVRHYRRWLRVCAAIEQMAHTDSLTDIAYASGFYDSSDLAHAFRQMLGIAPSRLFRNSLIAQDKSAGENYK